MLMLVICAILIWCVLLYGHQCRIRSGDAALGFKNEYRYTVNETTFVTFVFVLVFVSTVRHGFIDTYAYKIMYELSRNNLDYVHSKPWGVEAGWLYILYFLNFITKNPTLMLLLSAFVINYAFAKNIRDYSADVVFSLLIYFSLSYLDTNNGLRQYTAAAIIMLAFPLLIKKKYLLYVILVILASRLHNSAIFGLLIAALATGRPLNIKMKAFIVAGIFFVFFPALGTAVIGDMFQDSKYLSYLEISEGFGMSFLRALITGIIPGILSALYISSSKNAGRIIDKAESLLLNIVIINAVFIIMGLYMQYWARFAFYTSFAPMIMMPKLVYEILSKGRRDYKTTKTIASTLYIVFFLYNAFVNWKYGALKDFYFDIKLVFGAW